MTNSQIGPAVPTDTKADQLALNKKIRQLEPLAVPYGPDELQCSIIDRFERMVEALPDTEIARDEYSSATYAELNGKANRIANAVLQVSGDRQQAVGIMVQHGVGTMESVVGVLKTGNCYVPLDPAYPDDRLRYIVEDAGIRTIVTDRSYAELARSLSSSIELVTIDALPENASDTNIGIPNKPDDYAYIIYTSGSTGEPKGVIENHRDVKWFSGGFIESDRITQADVQTGFTSLSFSGLAAAIYVSMMCGATTLFLDPTKLGVDRLLELMRTSGVTHASLLPSLFRRMKESRRVDDGWPTIRLARFGGSAVIRDDIKDFFKWARHAHFRHSLGLSEIKHVSSYLFANADAVPAEGVPIGYECDGLKVMLLDDDGNEVAAGEVGEIVVKGAFISPGYWNLLEVTERTFYGQPNGDPDRYMRTGDLGMKDENGCLFHKGRKDFQVKIRGYRVEIEEVEAALRNAPGVADAAVGVSAGGPSEERMIAVFVPDRDFDSTTAIRRRAARSLPFQMVPTVYIETSEIPKTTSGKIDRKALDRLINGADC